MKKRKAVQKPASAIAQNGAIHVPNSLGPEDLQMDQMNSSLVRRVHISACAIGKNGHRGGL